jgi:hypothetical protein
MPQEYYCIVTDKGLIKEAASKLPGGNPVELKSFAIGDGGGVYNNPTSTDEALVRQVYKMTDLSLVEIDVKNPNQLIVEGLVPEDTDGESFYIREVGIFDADGDLFAIGKYPETYKSDSAQGSGKKLYIRMIIGFVSTPNVEISISSDINLSSTFEKDLNDRLDQIDDDLAQRLKISQNLADLSDAGVARNNLALGSAALANDATTSAKGIAKIASLAEVNQGTNQAKIVTPATLKKSVSDVVEAQLNNRLQISENLDDLGDKAVARENLDVYSKSEISGRNYIINGGFDVWQRGSNFNLSGIDGYTADRWLMANSGATSTVSREIFDIGQSEVPGNPNYFLRMNVTSSSDHVRLIQRIEDVQKLSGKTLTCSFWAKTNNPKTFFLNLVQFFGAGFNVPEYSQGNFDVTTSWQKFTIPVIVPSISGQILAAGNSAAIEFRDPVQPNGSLFTLDIAQVQLEEGSVATNFEHRHFAEELVLCQRYYEKGFNSFTSYTSAGGNNIIFAYQFSVRKRVIPSMSITINNTLNNNPINIPSLSIGGLSVDSYRVTAVPVNSGFLRHYSSPWEADAEL